MTNAVTQSISIKRNADEIFNFLSDLENFQTFMEPIDAVEKEKNETVRWKVKGPFGTIIEWKTEVIRFEEDKLIAWKTIEGDIDTKGEIYIKQIAQNETEVEARVNYEPGKGLAKPIFESTFGNRDGQLIATMQNLKAVIENKN